MTGPLVVGIGGTTRPGSSSERLLTTALGIAESGGARTVLFGSADLDLPIYAPERPDRTPAARRLVSTVAAADAVIIASPGYHGGVSGLVKNALDYLEDLREDARPYLDGRAVGCLVSADGAQAGVQTLAALRGIVHALRGWPTPLGLAVRPGQAAADGFDPAVSAQLTTLVGQVLTFAERWGTETRATLAGDQGGHQLT